LESMEQEVREGGRFDNGTEGTPLRRLTREHPKTFRPSCAKISLRLSAVRPLHDGHTRCGRTRRLPGTLTSSVTANTILFVPTTIHIPDPLLERVDTRAKTLGISRNRLIIEALEEKVGARDHWAPEVVQMLGRPILAAAGKELEGSLAVVRRRRSSRRAPPKL
jgi:hypothetical protein